MLSAIVLAAENSSTGPHLEDLGDAVVLSNPEITATIVKTSASIRSLVYQETDFIRLDHREGIYYSMDGGSSYRVPSGCEYFIHQRTPEFIDVGMRQKWTTQRQAVDIEIHYVIHATGSGLHSYAILRHPAEYPATRIGEWRMVWKLPDDLLDTICVDAMRHRQMPTIADITAAEPTGIKEISRITTGVRAGKFECKYDYNANYYDAPFWGLADSRSGLGAWMISGSHEWFNDGPTKQDLTAAERILHIHFGMNHYNGSSTRLAAGKSWSKIYGPFLLYLNKVSGGTDASIRDAREQLETERAAWPYPWLVDQPDYPSAAGRGTVTGRFTIHDPAKPALTTANAWIGVAQPEPGGNWQFESNHYQYWTRAASDGSFTIPNIRPGGYTLYAFVDGAVGEIEKSGIQVTAGQTNALGDLKWEIPRNAGKLVWEIGKADRSAAEFRHGKDYFQGYLWKGFGDEWPNPLEYTIGTSDPSKDWNYAQSGYPAKRGSLDPWKWKIHFTLADAPAADATLTLAVASADGAHLEILANGGTKPVVSFSPSVQGGNALLRESIHAKYCVHRVSIPAKSLKKGNNTLTLIQTRTRSPSNHVMYDYLSLEVPDVR